MLATVADDAVKPGVFPQDGGARRSAWLQGPAPRPRGWPRPAAARKAASARRGGCGVAGKMSSERHQAVTPREWGGERMKTLGSGVAWVCAILLLGVGTAPAQEVAPPIPTHPDARVAERPAAAAAAELDPFAWAATPGVPRGHALGGDRGRAGAALAERRQELRAPAEAGGGVGRVRTGPCCSRAAASTSTARGAGPAGRCGPTRPPVRAGAGSPPSTARLPHRRRMK